MLLTPSFHPAPFYLDFVSGLGVVLVTPARIGRPGAVGFFFFARLDGEGVGFGVEFQ